MDSKVAFGNCNQNFKFVSWQSIDAAVGPTQPGGAQSGEHQLPAMPVHVARGYQPNTAAVSPSTKAYFPILKTSC